MGGRKRKGRLINGILLIDKPVGLSSNDTLQRVKRLYQARKAGHTGSLDRLASGLLPVCLGEATKLSGFLLNADKRYRAQFRLGIKTSTGDAEGEVVESRPVPTLSETELEQALANFRGEIQQIPPMHSAIKHQGQRLYKLAHQGITVERKPRQVTIHEYTLLGLEADLLEVEIFCSKGTYVRMLAEDLGELLGCGASVQSLRRTASGPFSGEQMLDLATLAQVAVKGLDELDGLLHPMESALGHWPQVHLPEGVAFYLRAGQPVLVPHSPTEGWVCIMGEHERFLGVGEVLDDGRIAPRRLIQGNG